MKTVPNNACSVHASHPVGTGVHARPLPFTKKRKNKMKKKFAFVMGLFALLELIYKLIKCPSCESEIFWFQVPGFVYLLFWGILATIILYDVYKANRVKKKVSN